MSFNSNTWYYIQNFGSDWYLGCSNVGNCATASSSLVDPALFQIAAINGSQSYYLRPKALNSNSNGEAYCVNFNSGQPAIATCSNSSASWGIGAWSGGNGNYFFSSQTGDTQRLSLSNDQAYSLVNATGLTASEQAFIQWGITSRSAINDQRYSTVPPALTGGVVTVTSTSATSSATSTSSTASSSSSSASITSSSSSAPASSTNAPSTMTLVVTPTVTASQQTTGGSRTSGASVSPTLASGAGRTNIGIKTAFSIMVVVPQVLMWLS